MDLSSALGVAMNSSQQCDYTDIDVTSDWPDHKFPEGLTPRLDHSQRLALKRMLSTDVAIIQGPPGTGKTHVSVAALQVMLAKWKVGDPPIVVSCQTNHALDQLLLHIAKFETNFVRLGGRSSDTGIIKQRTLFELRNSQDWPPPSGAARKGMRKLENKIASILAPFHPETGAFDQRVFFRHGVITQEHLESLESIEQGWKTSITTSDPTSAQKTSPIESWLGDSLHLTSREDYTPESLGFPRFEEELDDEPLTEDAAERAAQEDAIESLKGLFRPLAQKWTAYTSGPPTPKEDDLIRKLLIKKPKLAETPFAYRGRICNNLVRQCKDKMATELLAMMNEYNELSKKHQMGVQESNSRVLKSVKLIGVTTTGFSKYRALIASTSPKVVMLEEAGESLECTVIPLFIPSIEQIIQVVSTYSILVAAVRARRFALYPFERTAFVEMMLTEDIG